MGVARVEIWLTGSNGLQRWRGQWMPVTTRLRHPTLLDVSGGQVALYDRADRLCCLNERCFAAPPGVELLRLHGGELFLLSGETNSLSRYDDRGNLLVTTAAGIDPQDFCFFRGMAAVCGHLDGCIHLLSLPELRPVSVIQTPGWPLRITGDDQTLAVLSVVQEEPTQTMLLRIDPVSGAYAPMALLGGWPGAVAMDQGGIWVATQERVVHFAEDSLVPDARLDGFGGIRFLAMRGGWGFIGDTMKGCYLLQASRGEHHTRPLYQGELGQCCFS